MYTNTELCHTSETNIMLYVSYMPIFLKETKECKILGPSPDFLNKILYYNRLSRWLGIPRETLKNIDAWVSQDTDLIGSQCGPDLGFLRKFLGDSIKSYVVHWRREWQTTSVFLPWEPHEEYEKAKW